MKLPVAAVLACLCTTQVIAKENIHIELQPPQTRDEKQAASEIKTSHVNQTLTELSDHFFPFEKTLNIVYGKDEGPLYNPENHTIYIPYDFYTESRSYFSENKYEKKYGKSAQEGALDTLLHTLLHEVGHAYIEDKQIPVLGKEEDAVDNFATIILLNYVDDGDEIAISAADMFAFESADRPDYYDFGEYIDEHSFDLQRYFSTLCLVYGSNPEKFQYLLDEVEKDYLKDRKEFCVENFEVVNDNWHRYLPSDEQ
ncbi:DUF4344 domain-containing metallopeptidase [Photobacterium sp. CCB-ST2H9]|uniref:DUF4344 domain-containing metallopeptidase n=1 Tax=Photobacterium sp. CCB-ST2H9 TaxID=2912855 RepID=UPI0020067784|nr:DUF4344 domain-containing metallopeptidase [Photobacterium sp. CCB-ST2H9]UTM56054.1 DUF4344 domain-containing metallopeptidase [Photobacterium sp. CCB-ST2H9]